MDSIVPGELITSVFTHILFIARAEVVRFVRWGKHANLKNEAKKMKLQNWPLSCFASFQTKTNLVKSKISINKAFILVAISKKRRLQLRGAISEQEKVTKDIFYVKFQCQN